jgi:hemoglobin
MIAEDYGTAATSFEAAGGEPGLARLVARFYELMDTLPVAREIRAMHPPDLSLAREKLEVFLAAWLGGPNRYRERFGRISIPGAHARFPIAEAERDAWLECMRLAVDEQPWRADFKHYFMRAIEVPAERIRQTCAARRC